MPLPASRAQAIAACLTAAGFEPQIRRFPGFIRVEVVPGNPRPAIWRALLAALERADRFGLDSGSGRATAWAHVFTEDGDGGGHTPSGQP